MLQKIIKTQRAARHAGRHALNKNSGSIGGDPNFPEGALPSINYGLGEPLWERVLYDTLNIFKNLTAFRGPFRNFSQFVMSFS
jgi:hypothetical protein